MKSVKDLPIAQDGPPPGGFPAIRYARRIPNTGPTGATIFGVTALLMGYGFYRVIEGNHKRRYERHMGLDKCTNLGYRAERREVRMARIALMPMLQAEEDRRYAVCYRSVCTCTHCAQVC